MNDEDLARYEDLTTPEELRLGAIAISKRRKLWKYQDGYYVVDENGGADCATIEQVRQFLEEGWL
jgi:uncharacterized protein YerC